jgi:hypothetical protein
MKSPSVRGVAAWRGALWTIWVEFCPSCQEGSHWHSAGGGSRPVGGYRTPPCQERVGRGGYVVDIVKELPLSQLLNAEVRRRRRC